MNERNEIVAWSAYPAAPEQPVHPPIPADDVPALAAFMARVKPETEPQAEDHCPKPPRKR